MLLGSMGFAQCLGEANVVGIAYGPAATDAFGTTVPQLTLVAREGEHLALAFEEFNTWVRQTDGDAIEITIVFRNAGGYVLALSQNLDRLRRRMLNGDTVYDAVFMSTTWFKSMDTVHPMLLKLREYCRHFPAPIVLGGAEYSPLRDGPLTKQMSVREVPAIVPVLKFELTFVDENDVAPGSIASAAIRTAGKGAPHESAEPTHPVKREKSAAAISATRVATIGRYFPVTIERLRRDPRFEALCGQLLVSGYARWQVEQAVCNFILASGVDLATRVSSRSDRELANDDDLSSMICDAVRNRYEMADGKELPVLPITVIAAHALADGVALLRATGNETPIASATELRAALESAGYADAVAATAVPVGTNRAPAM